MHQHGRKLMRFFSTLTKSPKVAIIGGGPAGFYTAQQLVKVNTDVSVDIYERLPVPFGLVRYGVAPDHPEVKNVINTFTKTANHPNIRFIGNVTLGKDVFLREMKEAYHAIILTYGAERDKVFGIPGENLSNVISARRFVGWYNGLPEDSELKPDLDCESVVVLGQGNVAIDVSRILLTPVDILKKTDITAHSLDVISKSRVKTVHLVGRRGPLQVAFTIKEFREMLKLPDVATLFRVEQMAGVQDVIPGLPRPRKRLTELMLNSLSNTEVKKKTFHPVFLRSPVTFLGDGKVTGVKLSINVLQGDKLENMRAVETGEYEDLPCGIVLRSIGYQSKQVDPDVPFDTKTCRAIREPGIYSAGWLSTGPVGVILSTMSNAFEVGRQVAKEVTADSPKPGIEHISNILSKKGVQTVSFNDWERIDKVEMEQGTLVGKPREKIVNIDKMLQIAAGGRL